jgi:integrase
VVIPLRGFYASLIERKTLPGPNPAADLKFFIGKSARSKAQHPKFFSQDEGPKLIEAAQALYPRWAVFIMTGLLAGLRWGESGALVRSDIDWSRGRVHVQRTISGRGTVAPPKNGRDRWVKASSGVAPVRWTVNCFRGRHCTAPEGDSEIASPWSIVAPEGTGRSSLSFDRSKIMGDR